MSKPTSSAVPGNLLYPIFILTLILIVLGIAAWSATTSPARGLDQPVFIPTQSVSFSIAEIAKPTYTALPTSTTTASPTPESVVQAQIVLDTSISDENTPSGLDDTTAGDAIVTYGGNKSIVVDISEQLMYIYEGDALVNSFVSSTGVGNSTRMGTFSVLNKISNAYGATWNIWMPNWLGIYWSGSLQNGIHALPILPNGGQLWAGYLGIPISYGCVVLGVDESQWLYDWAEVGTPVEIQR